MPNERRAGQTKTRPDPSTVRIGGPWTHRDIHANGIRFHVVEGSPRPAGDAPLVVLLHGFADFWWTWRHQLTGLTEAGYHVVAVDLRGYGDSDKPPRGYDGWTLAGDVAGLIRALGYTSATLVGHADGGLVCWATAVLHPRLVRSIALISSPHPVALKQGVLRDRQQRSRWLPTFLRYQIPMLPERRLTRDAGFEAERLLRRRTGPDFAQTREFVDTAQHMRDAIRIPGAAHCALEYQRWAFRSQWRPDGRRFMAIMRRQIEIPVLQLRGELDPYILDSTLARCTAWAPDHAFHSISGAGHFAHLERPDDVTRELLRFTS